MPTPKPTFSDTKRDALALDTETMFPPGSPAVFCVQASRDLLDTEHVQFVAKNGGYPIYSKQAPSESSSD